MRDIKIYIEETLWPPGDKSKKKATPRHILVKLLKTKDRENLKSIQKEKKKIICLPGAKLSPTTAFFSEKKKKKMESKRK